MEFRAIPEALVETSISSQIEHLKKPLLRIIEVQELYKKKESNSTDYAQEAASEVVLLNAQKIQTLIDDILELEKQKLKKKTEPLIFLILNETDIQNQIYSKMSLTDKAWLKEIEDYVLSNISLPDLNLSTIAYQVAISERQLHRRINKLLGLTPNKYLRKLRMHKANQLLEERRYNTIQEVAREVGFLDTHYFVKVYESTYGIKPSAIIR